MSLKARASASRSKRVIAVLLAATALSLPIFAHADSLSDGFANPPNSARPRVWWHWMNGNVTQ